MQQTKSNYSIHNKYSSFLNPATDKIQPNTTLREFILNWVRDGKDISGTVIAREYFKATKFKVSRQRVDALVKQLGARTHLKIRKAVLSFLIIGLSAIYPLLYQPATELALQIPSIKQWVYPQTAYAVEPSTISEGVGESSSKAVEPVTSTIATPSASLSDKQEVMAYILEVFKDDAADAITMLRKCENSEFSKTHINQNANGSKDYSPMQINDIHIKRFGNEFTYDWKANVRVAKQIFDEQGWSPWACSRVVGVQAYWE